MDSAQHTVGSYRAVPMRFEYFDDMGGFIEIGSFELHIARDLSSGVLYAFWRVGCRTFVRVAPIGVA